MSSENEGPTIQSTEIAKLEEDKEECLRSILDHHK